MFLLKAFVHCILIYRIIATPQINLFYTDQINDNTLQHNCLFVDYSEGVVMDREIMFYCMSELPSKFDVKINQFVPRFTFADLSKQNITSEKLFLWSAPIDLIDRYQSYLNELSTSNKNSPLATNVFYNCTMPRFGPMCQYELNYNYDQNSTLDKIIFNIYRGYPYMPSSLTCYKHLQCNRGPSGVCLDWSEICDGKIDCLNDGLDEKDCWQLEINECKDNEYRCKNGQCIPRSFYNDLYFAPDCIDMSDQYGPVIDVIGQCSRGYQPTFMCEDIACADSPYTSSCFQVRSSLLVQAMYSHNDDFSSTDCWFAFKCLYNPSSSDYSSCARLCTDNTCIEIVKNKCPPILYYPNIPVLFSDIYFGFLTNYSSYFVDCAVRGLHICYKSSHFDDYFISAAKIRFDQTTCVNSKQYLSQSNGRCSSAVELINKFPIIIENLHSNLKTYHLAFNYTSEICNRSNMYQCIHSSKCIHTSRLLNNIHDCPHMDDENITVSNNPTLIEQFSKTHFKCQLSNKYISITSVSDRICDCFAENKTWCEDEDFDMVFIRKHILFQHICDGFIDLIPLPIGENNETDETECEHWECNNTYTYHNGIWNCPNGADEGGYRTSPQLNCSSHQHLCVSPNTSQLICLSLSKANDGNIDCIGATDEPKLCGKQIQSPFSPLQGEFYCQTEDSKSCVSADSLCDNVAQCKYADDEKFCKTNRTSPIIDFVCAEENSPERSDVENFLCYYRTPARLLNTIHFKPDGLIIPDEDPIIDMDDKLFSKSSVMQIPNQPRFRCHRGINLRVWLNNKNNLTSTCLCPLSYYGNQCQYQNQRISLAIKFRSLSDSWQTLFAIIISLIDDSNERIIHSHEQFSYLSIRDCETKFNAYLFYANRPKDPTKNYSIHIDFYEKSPLKYRGSILLPVQFSFLPVHRLAFIAHIPPSNDKTQACSNKQCIHGKCIKYWNNLENKTFCQCEQGWSGRNCTIQHRCMCPSDSSCIGVSANNRSICVCSMNKLGPRCLLKDKTCQNDNNKSKCENNGKCISNTDYSTSDKKFTCICLQGYSGDRCQLTDGKLIVFFDVAIVLSPSISIHFIQAHEKEAHTRLTTFRTIPIRQDSIIIHWLQPFHLVFIELESKTYYLTVVQKVYNRSLIIRKTINPSDRCWNISELFNLTFFQWHLLRRIKYYHLPCQNQSINISCFYDETHLCFCYNYSGKRLANCFNFHHNVTFNCTDRSECENDAECIEDKPECPTRSICRCLSCYYGTRCQFSTSGFDLSLDAILSYHILPHVRLTQQSAIVQFSLAFTIIFMMVGLINGILCLITFKNKPVREVGCGLYLLVSSITTLLTMFFFGLKFLILVLAQMKTISNRTFLEVQCHSVDFLLRVCLCADQWLSACVAIERATTAIKGTRFDKTKSKQAAKYVIIILPMVIVGSFIQDPLYRRLFDEENDDDDMKRTWCIATYSHSLQIYNYFINTFHFFGPFISNLVSSIVLIVVKSHQQLRVHPERIFREVFRQQIKEHKHLLTAPVVLAILAIPRLIITFVSGCMKSANDSWLFLIGYLISIIPTMITCIVFIVPSKFYKKQFRKSVSHYGSVFRRSLHPMSPK